MRLVHLLCFVVLASIPLYAQDEAAEVGPVLLPAEVALQFEQRIEKIRSLKSAVVRLRAEIEKLDGGLPARLYEGRLDSVWAASFNETVGLAEALVVRKADGFDVSAYVSEIATDLRAFPEESVAALERLREDIVYPSGELTPGETAVQDQYLLRATQKLDFVLQSMLTYMSIAEKLGIATRFDADYVAEVLKEAGANRSVFVMLATENASVMRAAAAALPLDTDVAARVSVAETRVRIASDALQQAINLMKQMDLDASQYSQQVVSTTRELTADVLDAGVLSALAKEWTALTVDLAKTKGPQLLFRVILMVLILFVFLRLGRLVQSVTRKALRSSRVRFSELLSGMVVATARNLTVLLGILIALSQVGISLGPLLAGLGIAGFIIGFALQDTLSNFASGMMILMYRPFDVGDFVTAGGVTGKVSDMSPVNTTLTTLDNQRLVIPNNMVWTSVITNVTAQKTRRVDLMFGVAYDDDVEKVEKILTEIVSSHPSVLSDPEPAIKLHEFADSSVNFIVRPWVNTDDYWDTYWDIMRAVKLRFDAEGITIPFPQRQIHTA